MRVAVMIIALCLTMLIGLQSCAATLGGSLLQDEATTGAGAVGVLLAFVFVLGAAFVIGFPRVAGTLFLVGGAIAFLAGMGSRFTDLSVWGVASIILSLMAFVGSRELSRRIRYVDEASEQQFTRSAGYDPGYQRRSLLSQNLAVLAGAIVIVGALFATGVLRLGDFAGNRSDANLSAAANGSDTDYAAVEGDGEIDAPAATASTAEADTTPFVDAAGRQDAASSTDVPQVTKAWLLGQWGPLPNDGDRRGACENDSTVTFEQNDEFQDGGSRGSFTTDGRSITYHHRVLFDLGEDGEDRSQYDRPLISRVEAVDANTMREDGTLLLRCSSL